MEATERALFEAGVRRATETADGVALNEALDDLGWRDALEADRPTAVSVLFESQGAATASSAAFDWLLASVLGVDAPARAPGGGAAGGGAVVLPPLRRCEPPGRVDGDWCVVEGLGTAALDRSDTALVVARTPDGVVTFAVDLGLLTRRPVQGLDPALGLFEVMGEFETAWAAQPQAADWPATVAVGQLALGHELVGAGRTMLQLARTHALERQQFGRPIGSFQAVRHRLAESLVALEAAAALLDAAWEDPSPVTAAMAKAFAGRSTRSVARHCQQVLAGIGFTTEHPLHCSVRRVIVLDQLLGAGSVLTRTLGNDILASARLPSAFPL
jgi:alkylation response protein AidB-like acyl-CoA dehydrogenase